MRRRIIRRILSRRAITPIMQSTQSGMKLINGEILKKFNPSTLDLGDISLPSQEIETIATVFDLSSFTQFCNQVDAHLAIPKFLNDFLDWLFSRIRIGLTNENTGEPESLWAEPPILSKFLGDGVLLLWNTRNMTDSSICRIVAAFYDICRAYRQQFYPQICTVVDKPPSILRCGLARGKVFSIGNGKDYVGHCINTASRLSNLRFLSFCFHHRGISVQEHMPEEYNRTFIKKYLSIRGVGEDEPVWVVKEEFDRLPGESKELFRNHDDFKEGFENTNRNFGLNYIKV